MENIVLGLLLLKSMTIYELNQAFSMGLSMIYAASYGNLQYAMKKLLSADMIAFDEKVENGRNKKIYHIKQGGIAAFFSWMMSDADPKHIETIMLSKVYFLGLVDSDSDKLIIIDKILAAAGEYAKELAQVKSTIGRLQLGDDEMRIAKYQFATLGYGIGAYDFAISWLKDIKEEIEKSK